MVVTWPSQVLAYCRSTYVRCYKWSRFCKSNQFAAINVRGIWLRELRARATNFCVLLMFANLVKWRNSRTFIVANICWSTVHCIWLRSCGSFLNLLPLICQQVGRVELGDTQYILWSMIKDAATMCTNTRSCTPAKWKAEILGFPTVYAMSI